MNHNDELSFVQLLLADVTAADKRHQDHESQSAKRDLVRTSFAGIEGVVWIFREHIRELAVITGALKEAEALALSETTYGVDASGRVNAQQKFLQMPATIRLCARIAERISGESKIDFSANEWNELKNAIKIRNRITHPKKRQDLDLSERDLSTCISALHWFLEQSTNAMAAANKAAREYVDAMGDILTGLEADDPKTLQEYQAAKDSLNRKI